MESYKKEDEKTNIVHYPTLKTILMVEEALRSAPKHVSREELKKLLPSKVMHQTLNLILEYLEKRKMVSDDRDGILWISNSPGKLNVQEKVIPHYVR